MTSLKYLWMIEQPLQIGVMTELLSIAQIVEYLGLQGRIQWPFKDPLHKPFMAFYLFNLYICAFCEKSNQSCDPYEVHQDNREQGILIGENTTVSRA